MQEDDFTNHQDHPVFAAGLRAIPQVSFPETVFDEGAFDRTDQPTQNPIEQNTHTFTTQQSLQLPNTALCWVGAHLCD